MGWTSKKDLAVDSGSDVLAWEIYMQLFVQEDRITMNALYKPQ